jgi:dTDP-4-amino-4,6-dideoxygalactose transaminase
MQSRQVAYVNLALQHARIKQELLAAVAEVIDQAQFILGAPVERFEKSFAELCGVQFAVGLNSGTDALILALRVLGIGPGDEVITVPNSFVASAAAIALVGARPVFVDVRKDYNLDPELLAGAITPRTRAIIPVHLTGRPCEMDSILEIARQYRLFVIEDSAQAVAAEYRGKKVGSLGDFGCFSLHPLKTLNACGDGGVITTNNLEWCERLRVLRNIGLRTRDDCQVWSGNSRLDSLQAAILSAKLPHLREWTEGRRRNAFFYQQNLSGLSQIRVPKDGDHEYAVYHTFVIQAERRDELKNYLALQGIGTAVHYPVPIHLTEAARALGYARNSFPVTEFLADRILSLPVYPELTSADLNYVVDRIQAFYRAR